MRLHAIPDRTLVRAGAESVRYLRISFTAPSTGARGERLPANTALVLDRSGSMGGSKLALAKEAVEQALRLLSPEDRFALVVYDDEVELLAESTPATPEACRRALARLRQIEARGSTDLGAGWLAGADQLVRTLGAAGLGRCLLLTDGLANHGLTDRGELVGVAAQLRSRGISTSTFGVGEDFDERLLVGIAEASLGNFYFLEHEARIPELLASELQETLDIVARDALLQVHHAPGLSVEPIRRHRSARYPERTDVQLGHVVAGQEIELVLRVGFPRGTQGEEIGASLVVTDPAESLDSTTETVRWRWASHEENDRQPRDRDVDFAVATAYAGRARDEALNRNRDGDVPGARRVLLRTARRIRDYAGDDRRLLDLVRELERQAQTYGERRLSALELKQGVFAEYAVAYSRSPSGKARRK